MTDTQWPRYIVFQQAKTGSVAGEYCKGSVCDIDKMKMDGVRHVTPGNPGFEVVGAQFAWTTTARRRIAPAGACRSLVREARRRRHDHRHRERARAALTR
jgi:hypothetical protein